jgi:hypothetical protein
MKKFALTALAIALIALTAHSVWAGEPSEGDEETGEGEKAPQKAERRKLTLASDLVINAKVIAVTRCCREKEFTGNFRIRLMAVEVLKGILGPVDIIELRIPLTELPRIKPFLKRLTRADNPSFVVFLDEIARFHLPPLFRLTAQPISSDIVPEIREIVADRISDVVEMLKSPETSKRDSAFKTIVSFGHVAVETLRELQKDESAVTAEEARLALNSIHRLKVDPFRVFQINRKFPCEPVPIFVTPLCRETIFRLSPDSLVFRINSWDDGNQHIYRVRTSDGREGWIPAKACVRVNLED